MELRQNMQTMVWDKQPVIGMAPSRATDRLWEVLYHALTLTGACGAAIARIQGDRLVTLASAGAGAPAVGSQVSIATSFAGLCAQSGHLLHCEDTQSDERLNAAACRALNVRSILVAPVSSGDAVAGVIVVSSPLPRAFTNSHVAILDALAMVLGRALPKEAKILVQAGPPPKPASAATALRTAAPAAARPVSQAWQATPSPLSQGPCGKTHTHESTVDMQSVTQKDSAPVSLAAAASPLRGDGNVQTRRPATPAAIPAPAANPANTESHQILRFRKSERMIHWSIAIPFLVCFTTALILVIFYNLHPQRPYRLVFSYLHRLSGACLVVLPLWSAMRAYRDRRIHLGNVREALTWGVDEVKWLLLMGPAALNSKIELPPQGKFNAAEKMNFLMVLCTCPLFAATGLLIWSFHVAFLSWVVHLAMAALAAPLMLGHIFMATVNPGTRVGLSGMFSGYVDRHWAAHHYTRWYRKNFAPGHAIEETKRERQGRFITLFQCPSEGE